MKRIVLLTGCLIVLGVPAARAWDGSRLTDPIVVNELVIPYPEFAVYVMPNRELRVGFVDATGGATITLDGRELERGATIRAPEAPGLSRLEIRNDASGETATINVFTMWPSSRVDPTGHLNGFRIGDYPAEPLRGLDIYRAPPGFVEVTADNAATRVSPNFTLGQFVAKQAGGYPKYVVLRPELLLKLESVLGALNTEGHRADGLVIMSGYRTPFYNRAIGNVPYSRHVFGGAADVYVDSAPVDGVMDDMNRDGRLDRDDAHWLASFVDAMSRRGAFGPSIGGIGIYGANAAHGPFVHIDARGTRARW